MATKERKEDVVKTLLLESALANDWNMLKIILKQCWNKTRLFGDICNDAGDSLLHITCRENFLESTKVLIEHGLSADYRNSQGDTCLHIAAKNENSVILNLLFEAGANPLTKNNDDKQPVDMTKNRDIEELLRQYSLRSAELQLWKKFHALKELIAEEQKKEHYDLVNQKYRENCIRANYLKNSDSDICSDSESIEKLECKCCQQSPGNVENDLVTVKERVKSLHISSTISPIEKAELRDRLCRSCYDGENLTSLLEPPSAISPNSVRFDTKEKLTKSKSIESTVRRRKTIDGTHRRKRLSLPAFQNLGSTESYV